MSGLSRRTARLFLRSLLIQAGFGDERLQGLGFAWAIDPELRESYARDAAGLSRARTRHLEAFNASPAVSGLLLGAAAAAEAAAAAGAPEAVERARVVKTAFAAPLSGAADALFWGALRPLAAAAAICVFIAGRRWGWSHPLFWGAGLGLAAFNFPSLGARWLGARRGLEAGASAAAEAAALPLRRWTALARVAAGVLVFLACAGALSLPFGIRPILAALSFAAGAVLSGRSGGALKLVGAAAMLGAAASAAGLAP